MTNDIDVDAYLTRIGWSGPVHRDVETLEGLQRAHLSTVPFENLNVFHQVGVQTSTSWSVPKVVGRRRGGWCFEVNGAFGALLETLGFEVAYFGAAVLLDGPNDVIDHLTLQVTLEEPWLVDVGFGDSFIRPLRLNGGGPQDGGAGQFELVPSPKGTTLTREVDGLPAAQFRFKRVNRQLSDFDVASRHLQTTPGLHWTRWPFATRLLDGGPDRVTLLADRLKITRAGETEEQPVNAQDWDKTLSEWFAIDPTIEAFPGQSPASH